MTQEKMSPLRARMIPLGTLLRNALPGSGGYAYARDGGHIAEGAHPSAQGFHCLSGAVTRYGDAG